MTLKKPVFFILFAASILFTTACTESESSFTVQTMDDVKLDVLKDYIGTQVDSNSDVQVIVEELVGGETLETLNLTNEMINVTYDLYEGSIMEDDVTAYWLDGNNVEKNFYFNAIYLTILVPNAKEFHFHVGDASLSVTREDIERVLSAHTNYPKKGNQLSTETVSKYIDNNHGTFKEMAENYQEYFK
ncbi:hypothetical protein NC661_10190 [Aquibacillus koreensis]|uniref:DUF4825 domain-containing protein n=1 Tax=Aquibacillus koreensis TaxID=279446 RepID=A0A9X3WJ63_9BACI|nr:hypothetical protein [Aquibacillus koreensis]MCT2534218.1 hypothetical protein [Aquibacillus koreensis]MDC3420737.1 hypothetical protein [Aquibacillus koreensis]